MAALGRRFPAGWLGVVLTAAAVGSAAGAFLLGALAGTARGGTRPWLLAAGAALAGGTVALGVWQQRRTGRRLRTAEQVAVEAEEQLTLTLNGALAPITSYLGEMADAGTLETRATIAGQVRQAVVDAVVTLTPAGSRSAYYAVDPYQRSLSREAYAGRAAVPRESFDVSDPAGAAVLDLVARGDLVFIADVSIDPMVQPSTPGSYGTVIAVAVTAGTRRLGMLTVDAVDPGDLNATHMGLVRVFANLLGSGLAQASPAQ